LADPIGFEKVPATPDAGLSAADGGLAAADEGDLALLLATVRRKLAPFAATAGRDRHFAAAATGSSGHDPRLGFVAMYRNGQRCVLEEVVAALEAEKRRREVI
jgi:hypothetical protein